MAGEELGAEGQLPAVDTQGPAPCPSSGQQCAPGCHLPQWGRPAAKTHEAHTRCVRVWCPLKGRGSQRREAAS